MGETATVKKSAKYDESEIKSNTRQFLTFLLGNEVYGVEVKNVREVIEYENVYKIPVVPKYIRGVINLRGEVVPVIDLSYRFYSRKSEVTKLSCIVIVEIESDGDPVLIGFVIDSINAVVAIPEDSIDPTPGFGAKIRGDYIDGVGKMDGKFIILLSVNRVLDIEELSGFNQEIIV